MVEVEAKTCFDELINELKQFCDNKEKIYIYGAGKYAQRIYRFLVRHDISVYGFLVTDRGKSAYEGCPITCIQEKINELDHTCGIILGMKEAYKREVEDQYGAFFRAKGVDVRDIDDKIVSWLHFQNMENKIEEWHKTFSFVQDVEKNDWKNILVIQLEHVIGDYIWGSAFLRELKRNFPDAHVTYVINKRMRQIFRNCPYINKIISYDYSEGLYSEALEEKVKNFAGENFAGQKYDVAFLVKAVPCHEKDAIDNVLIALYSHAGTCITHGFGIFLKEILYTDFWQRLFPVMAVNDKAEHDVSKNLSLLRICGLDIQDERMELWTSPEDKRWAKSLLKESVQVEKKIVIALGVAAREPRRSWPAEFYAELIRRLETRNIQLCYVIFGGDNAVEAAEIILGSAANILNIAGKTTLTESIAVMEQCDLYVGSDTSLLHMAAAFGHPVIELTANLKDGCETDMGHPVRTGPWKVPGKVLYPQRQLDDCTHVCVKEYAHCITQIDIREVEEAVRDMIDLYCKA